MSFAQVYGEQVRYQDMGYDLWSVTSGVYTGMRGILPPIQRYIYLYIPLITMGLMSREYQSGSIKLCILPQCKILLLSWVNFCP